MNPVRTTQMQPHNPNRIEFLRGVPTRLADWLPSTGREKIDIHLEGEEYRRISDLEASRLLGYFTQKMQEQGFPWKLEKPGEGLLGRKRTISELEALDRLKKGQPVLFQPRRNLQLDLSPNSLDALAAAGSVAGTGLNGVSRVADLSKKTRIDAGQQGFELDFGAPVTVSSYGELKLLAQMYNPDLKPAQDNAVGRAAHQLSYFTKKTLGTPHPWRFYKKGGNAALRLLKAFVKNGLSGAVVGGLVGGMIGVPIGLFTGQWGIAQALAAAGAALGGAFRGVDAARVAAKGQGIHAVEALERILEGKPVVFQETQMRSIKVPLFGTVSWFSDYHKGSEISNLEELETFYYMQDQDAELPQATG